MRQSAYRIIVSSSPARLALNKADLWDSGKVPSNRTLGIVYAGRAQSPGTPYFWKVMVWDQNNHATAWSGVSQWATALDPADWKAHWIADEPDNAAPDAKGRDEGNLTPMPLFRHSFSVTRTVTRAILYTSGLGLEEVHLNGEPIDHSQLYPGQTDYRVKVLYNAFNVTSRIHRGQNVLGVMLGNGIYNVRKKSGRYTKLLVSFGQPKCIVQLDLTYSDGNTETVVSNGDWKTAPGPIVFSSYYGGEDYDARKQLTGWDRPSYDDSSWHSAVPVSGPGGVLAPQITPPIQILHTYSPIHRHTLPDGSIVFDLGKNFAGWPAIAVRGSRGSTVKLVPAELLKPDGSVFQKPSGTPQWFSYTLAGNGVEIWSPRFSFYGFRYVQVFPSGPQSAQDKKPVVLSLVGDYVHSSSATTGDIETSDHLLNQIHQLILQAIRNNMMSLVASDPHREKLGWLEETYLLAPAMNYDFDLRNLYLQMIDCTVAAQAPNGMVPEIAPEYTHFPPPFDDSPEWGSAIVLNPWLTYLRYGDIAILRDNFPAMARYVDYLTTRASGHIISYGLGDWLDLGPKRQGVSQLTSLGLTATATYYLDIQTLQRTATLLGKPEVAATYAALGAAVNQAFNQHFYHPQQHSYDTGSQTANAMPLALGLVPDSEKQDVLSSLIADIRAHNDHFTAGDIGHHYVIKALMENSRSDVIFAMLQRRDSPGYGYQLATGATALPEAWDASTNSSQDQYMLGAAETWFYRGMAGIDVDMSPDAADPFILEPAFVDGLSWVKSSYRSVLGTVSIGWHRNANSILLDITVPANATASLLLPQHASQVTESHQALDQVTGVSGVRQSNNILACHIASGTYHFVIRPTLSTHDHVPLSTRRARN